jgi:tetratricopeptide (TPR) repeat protein
VHLHHDAGRALTRFDAIASEARLNGTSARRHLRSDIATHLEDRGDAHAAFAEIRRAAAIEPTHAWTRYRVADLARRTGDGAAEFEALRRTVELDPSLASAWSELGRAYLDRGAVEHAEECFRRALSGEPGNMKARIGLAIASARRGDVAGAIDEARAIAEDARARERTAPLLFLATVLENDGHADAAREVRGMAAE